MPETDQNNGSDGVLSFDLTVRPWIPVLRADGSQGELSLREVFEQAHGLRRIVGDLPTQEFALVRLLLAIGHDALDGPQDTDAWAELWADESCFAPVGAYLDAHRGRFDMLDVDAPFFQTAGLRTGKDEVFSLNRIVADVPNGEPFFTARMPTVERLTFAEAARWVVHAHAYDTSGIKTGVEGDKRARGGRSYPSSDLGVGWTGKLGAVFVEGNNLRETLLLNLIAYDTSNLRLEAEDRPAWRREPSSPGGQNREPLGLSDLYTWQSRRVRLHYDGTGVHGVVLGYGDPLSAVNRHGREPMSLWKRSASLEKELRRSPVYMPAQHDASRAAWRGLTAMLMNRATELTGVEPPTVLRPLIMEWVARLVTEGLLRRDYFVRTRIIGAAYDPPWAKQPTKSSFYNVFEDHVTMAVVLLHQQDRRYAEQAIAAVGDADLAVNALGDLATNLARAAGTETDGPRSSARDLAYGLLEAPYRTWLAHLAKADDPYAQRTVWQQQVYGIVGKLGDRLMAAVGDAAWQGRIVQLKHGTEWLNSALAGKWFRAALHKGLGRPDSSDMPPDADASPAPETTVKAPA
ncbi:type I-E CRISPR-associated protein Cse1/CasA [Streptomyces sp. NPDC001698]|uniref:type I-E CRISPR-associated protein Cse1/CasA n=1 Tax=Streptomyces sp. NPDC001698 TaxID=3364601 RepID=UPI00369E8C35